MRGGEEWCEGRGDVRIAGRWYVVELAKVRFEPIGYVVGVCTIHCLNR